MLYSIDTLKKINQIPHREEFEIWCSRLSERQIAAIRTELQCRISGRNVHTSSWMPGSDWEDTPWEPIYTHACERDYNAAAQCFGLFVWEAFLHHDEAWSFDKLALDGERIRGMTYFRIDPGNSG